MKQNDVLDRFKAVASTLGKIEPTQSDAILKLAQIIADASHRLTEEEIDRFVNVGAVLYQEALSEHRARTEVDLTMRDSLNRMK